MRWASIATFLSSPSFLSNAMKELGDTVSEFPGRPPLLRGVGTSICPSFQRARIRVSFTGRISAVDRHIALQLAALLRRIGYGGVQARAGNQTGRTDFCAKHSRP